MFDIIAIQMCLTFLILRMATTKHETESDEIYLRLLFNLLC